MALGAQYVLPILVERKFGEGTANHDDTTSTTTVVVLVFHKNMAKWSRN